MDALFFLKKLLSSLVLPPTGPIVLGLFGVFLTRRRRKAGQVIVTLAFITLGLLSIPPIADSIMRTLEPLKPLSPKDLSKAQAIIILSGDVYAGAPEYGGDAIGHMSLERVRYGVHLQQLSGLPILVSGGSPYGGRPSADTMKDVIEHDFRAHVEWIENASRDTAENAAFSARILRPVGITHIALVSDSWHLRRASELFEAQGLQVLRAPTGFITHPPSLLGYLLPSATALQRSSEALHEWLGIFMLRLKQKFGR